MEYNSNRSKLIIPEYGRNVQKMVNYLTTIEDSEERNKQAQNLIDIIGNLNPQIRDVPDFKHKLWDHLFIMSDFKLDVDSPYPKPSPETFMEKPELLKYPLNSRRFRHYGNVTKQMIKKAIEIEEGELKDALILAIANHMKKTYLAWNKSTVDDDIILKELDLLAEGQLKTEGLELLDKHELLKSIPATNNNAKAIVRNRKPKRNFKKK